MDRMTKRDKVMCSAQAVILFTLFLIGSITEAYVPICIILGAVLSIAIFVLAITVAIQDRESAEIQQDEKKSDADIENVQTGGSKYA